MEFSKEPGAYDHIVLNDKLDVAYKDLKEILSKVRVSCLIEKDYSFPLL